MKAAVFLGPSLPIKVARDCLDRSVEWRAPAAAGDIYRVAASGVGLIALVDGVFGARPAVQHHEILWALSQGCHVVGAASMGALRAAELRRFGMRGIGAIYAGYVAGRLCGDDEVALAYGPPELGYRPLTEPLVNVRRTLTRARADYGVPARLCARFLAIACETFFVDRTWPALVSAYQARFGVRDGDAGSIDTLLRCRVDQKAEDAGEMLRQVGRMLDAGERFKPRFTFNDTTLSAEFRVVEGNPFLRPLG